MHAAPDTARPAIPPRLPAIAGPLALALVAALCPAPSRAQDSALPSPARYSAVPVPAAQIDQAIAGLDALVEDVLARTGVPGLAVAVVRGGQTVYARGFGLRRVDGPDAVDADTVFLLASVSKPVGATVVARQVGAGLVTWETPVTALLPWFALSDDWVTRHLTIGDLYAHRSGLPPHAGDDLEDLGHDRRTVLERLALLPLTPFRASYAYTNFGLTAAAEAVAVAAGTDWATLSRQSLYEPLGMTATSSLHSDYMARANRASSHIAGPDGYVVADLRQPDAQSAAGGVSSSAADMARWMALILAGGRHDGAPFIAPDALLPAVTPQAVSVAPDAMDARAGTYGYGFNVGVLPSGRVVLGHSGAFALGAATTVSMVPSLGLGIVVLTNAAPVGAAEAIAATFLDQAQFGRPTRDWLAGFGAMMAPILAPGGALVGVARPDAPAPPRAPSAYAGRYANAYFGAVEIVPGADGALSLVIGPAGLAEPLSHWDGDVFTYAPSNENAPPGTISRVTFGAFDGARAGSLHIELLDEAGQGTFLR
jgi:CubicO group peptidase (beta-lactamase class C family)